MALDKNKQRKQGGKGRLGLSSGDLSGTGVNSSNTPSFAKSINSQIRQAGVNIASDILKGNNPSLGIIKRSADNFRKVYNQGASDFADRFRDNKRYGSGKINGVDIPSVINQRDLESTNPQPALGNPVYVNKALDTINSYKQPVDTSGTINGVDIPSVINQRDLESTNPQPALGNNFLSSNESPLSIEEPIPTTRLGLLSTPNIDIQSPKYREGVLGGNFVSGDGSTPSTFKVSNNPNTNLQSLDINTIDKNGNVKIQSGFVSKNVADKLGRGRGSFSVMQSSNTGFDNKKELETKLKQAYKDNNPFLISAYNKRLSAINQNENARLGKAPSELDIQKQQINNIKNVLQLKKDDNNLLRELSKKDNTSNTPIYSLATVSDQLLRRFSNRAIPLPTFKSILSNYGIDTSGSTDSLVDAVRSRKDIPQPLIEKLQESIASQQ